MSSQARTKRIFISDLHLNDGRCYEVLTAEGYKYPYYWTSKERAALLAKFLQEEVLESDDVLELVILGDLYDQWVVPTRPEPNIDFANIMNAEHNLPVKEQLVKIAAHKDITFSYVPGNHDLLIEQRFMETNFPGVEFRPGDQKYVGVYNQDGIGAEHGSQYNFFCAPNPGHPDDHYLPVGFFLSRFGAEEKAMKKDSPNFLEVLKDFVKNHFKKDEPTFIQDMLLSVGESVGLKDTDQITQAQIDQFGAEISLQGAAQLYSDAMARWDQLMPNGITAVEAIETEIFGYSGFAYTQYYKQNKARLVIFGHTHHAMMEGFSLDNSGIPQLDDDNGCDFIYANSGTWIDNHPCSFIVTEIKGDSHYITWNEYTDDGKIKKQKERHIFLK